MNITLAMRAMRKALHLLGQSGEVQLSSFPAFVDRPTEIVEHFYDQYLLIHDHAEPTSPSSEERAAIEGVYRYILAMTHEEGRLWTEDAVRTSPRWETLRSMANQALAVLGGVNSDEPGTGTTFVQGGIPPEPDVD